MKNEDADILDGLSDEEVLQLAEKLSAGTLFQGSAVNLARQGLQLLQRVTSAPSPADSRESLLNLSLMRISAGTVIDDRFRLLEPIGEGGMGSVWVAEQLRPVQRRVALKLVKPGMDSRQVLARFEAERQALAAMDHPNIARILDAGLAESQVPYFVMELVNGPDLMRYCDDQRLDIRQRLALFVEVSQAVQHAHHKGIIHRDLKPSNILVAQVDGRPVPKVIDFGLAKALGNRSAVGSGQTRFGAVVGTIDYMSPEQAGCNGMDIDTRADVYSLGVILYELLTGARPFDAQRLAGAALDEVLRIIKEEEPLRPSTRVSSQEVSAEAASLRQTEPLRLSGMLRNELDWIVMKSLEKDRNRRYETANGLAMDVQRYLLGEPVQAHPPSVVYRMRKFARRYRAQVVAAVLVAMALILGLIGTIWGLWSARNQEQLAIRRAIEKEAALEAELKARAAERQARYQALAALRSMTDEIVQEQMSREETVSRQTRNFLKRVIEQYDAFAELNDDDRESRAIKAEGRLRVGRMQYYLSEMRPAESALNEALALWTSLAEERPEEREIPRSIAKTHNALGLLFFKTGRVDKAEDHFRKALLIRKQLLRDDPGNVGLRDELATLLGFLGDVLRSNQQLVEAEVHLREAFELNRQLAQEFPRRSERQENFADSHYQLGSLLMETGRKPEGEKHWADAMSIRQQLANRFPGRADYRQKVAVSYLSLGRLLLDKGLDAEAESIFQNARDIRIKLANEFPTRPENWVEVASSHSQLSAVFRRRQDYERALGELEKALTIRRRLCEDYPDRTGFRRDLADQLQAQATLLDDQGKTAAAEKIWAEVVSLRTEMADQYPDRILFRRTLAGNHISLGRLYRDTERLEEAEREFSKALTIRNQLASQYPNDPEIQLDLANTYVVLANIALQHQEFAQSRRYLIESESIFEQLLEEAEDNTKVRQGFVAHRFAEVRVLAAENHYDQSVKVAEQIRDLGWDPPRNVFYSACAMARCAALIQEHHQLTEEEKAALRPRYENQALEFLKVALDLGLTNPAEMFQDRDLDSIRQRKEFQQLLQSHLSSSSTTGGSD